VAKLSGFPIGRMNHNQKPVVKQVSNRRAFDCQGRFCSAELSLSTCRPKGQHYEYQYLWPRLGLRNHRQFSGFPSGKAAGHLD
jgi:hypothetical protein